VIAQLLPQFRALHPDIEVRIQQLPWTAAHQKLLTAFAGEATPDVCQLGNTWIPEFVALKALEPLDQSLARSASVQASDYFPGIWDTNIIGGTLYGVPWYIDTRLLFYRRDLLAEAGFADPPRSWEEWSRMLAAIKARVGPERYSVLLPLDEFAPLLVLAIQQPEPLLREDGRYGNFRSAGFRRALAFYREMFQRQWAPPVVGAQISNVWDELGRGYYSFYISGPWNIGEFKRRLPPEQQGTWMTAPMPGPDGPGASLAGGSSLVIFRRSRHKQDAWLLLEFLSSPQIQQRFYQLTGDLPPRRSTWRAPELASNVYAHAFREQLERVKPTPKVPELERIVTDMRLMAERVVHGDLSVEEGAAELDRDVDAVLQKRRWLLSRGITP
ncbi:MAG TPA: sugar ABC transporter substrate-binding protein, partial [Steroidobacteraceae bacterium]|nr:sugar ABC transporter substrate-binding protein [Steroidobacteraceae bacterium]